MADTHQILKLRSKKQLSNFLDKSYRNLLFMARNPEYYSFKIPKKRGGYRLILAPSNKHKDVQIKINISLQALYRSMDLGCVYGFNSSQPGHIKANARKHIRKKLIFNTDIKDFFPNISATDVRDLFMQAPFYYNEGLATLMAMLCTYNNSLPTGAPSSPILSNFIFYRTDKKLKAFAERNDLSYSRYADDLTFSSNYEISKELIGQIYKIVEEDNFIINLKKSRLQHKYNRQVVTGITVNQKVNINRKYIRKIRAILYDIDNRGKGLASQRFFNIRLGDKKKDNRNVKDQNIESLFFDILRGQIEFIGFVRGKNDSIYLDFIKRLTILEIE